MPLRLPERECPCASLIPNSKLISSSALFLLTALVQFFISAHHQKEKKYGPGPSNGYTSGSGKRTWWQKKDRTVEERFPKDAEAAIVTAPVVAYEAPRTNIVRPSHDTTYTEATAVGHNHEFGNGTLGKVEQKTERAILPPVVDRPVSRAAVSRVESPVEVAAVPAIPVIARGASDYYPSVNETPGFAYSEPAPAGYYNQQPVVDRTGVDVTKAIYGHDETTGTGRHF